MDDSLKITMITTWLQQFTAPSAVLRLVTDSRAVRPGDVFFAYPVGSADGRDYIQSAVSRGAIAVIHEEQGFDWSVSCAMLPDIPHLAVRDLLWQSGFIASHYLGQPDAGMCVVAVTGTNGKTSCTQWLASAFSRLGNAVCVVGTLGVALVKNGMAGEFEVTGFTTPDAISLQQKLAIQRDAQASMVAIEASSIGLQQGRMNGMHVDVAILTNFTRDHLDFHGDMAAYAEAKTRLFGWINLQTAVLNFDDPLGEVLASLCKQRGVNVVAYSVVNSVTNNVVNSLTSPLADSVIPVSGFPDSAPEAGPVAVLQASGLRQHHGGTSFQLSSPFGSGLVKTQMIGRFNVSNVLAVMATLFARGVSWRDAVHAVEQLSPVSGRMEQMSAPGRVLVVVDYAHTPDALEKTLENLREVAQERQGALWCVFGCGGDRDAGKRPQMGRIAGLADHLIVTSDNPRNEDPAQIIADIMTGVSLDKLPVTIVEADRAKAILVAIKHAGKNDVVLLAGKGHEEYQEIKGKKYPFSDKQHAEIALANLAGKGVGL